MKKIFAIGLAAALSLTLLAGCGGGGENPNKGENTKPTISGVKQTATVMVGEEFDALAGVTATDKEDGDLTSKIEVTSDELTVTNGKTTPTMVNTSMGYFISYTVKDSGGLEATASTTLFVTEKVSDLENVYTADFTEPTSGEEDSHYWTLTKDGGEGTTSFENGAYAVDVTNPGEGEDKLYLSRQMDDLEEGTYTVVFWLYASAPIKTTIRALARTEAGEEPAEWNDKNLTHDGSDGYGKEVGATLTKISHTFDLTAKHIEDGYTSVLLRLGLGNHDGQPATYKVYVEKIALWKETGVENRTPLKSADYKTTIDGLYDNDHTAITQGTDGADVAITYSDTDNADWYAQVTIGLPDITVTKGQRYYYSIKVKGATTAIDKLIVCVEDSLSGWEKRNSYHEFQVPANDETVIEKVIVAGDGQEKAADLTDAVCRLYLGLHTAGTASNKLTIESFEFGTVEGDKETSRVSLDKFVLFGEDSSNKTDKAYPFAVYNGSDDDLGNKGVGTAYIKDGKLVYTIHEGSTVAGQNKLVIGFGANPITLPGNSIYEISLKIKASTAIKFDLCLHDMDYGDVWDDGLIFRRASYADGALDAGTTETTITLETEVYYKDTDGKCELILEFGSVDLSKLSGDVTIEISEIKIGAKTLAD